MDVLAVAWFTTMRAIVISGFKTFTEGVYKDFAASVGAVALSVVTLLVMIDGYRILTGATTEPAATYMLKWMKILVFTAAATSAGTLNGEVQTFIINISDSVGVLIAGENFQVPIKDGYVLTKNVYEMIIARMGAISAISSLATLVTSGLGSDNEVSKLMTIVMASIGSTLPVMTALVTSLMLELGLKIAVMMAPMCIFAGIFKRTEDWPLVWAKYMLGVMLVSALMAAMSAICVSLMLAYTAAAFVAFSAGTSMVVLSLLSTVIGLFLSMLLVSVPAVAVKVFGGIAEGVAGNSLGGDYTGGMYNPEKSQDKQSGSQIVVLSREPVGSFRPQETGGGNSPKATGDGNRSKGFGNRNLRFKNASDK